MYARTHKLTHVCACAFVFVRACVRAYAMGGRALAGEGAEHLLPKCGCEFVRACACVRACVCVRAFVHACARVRV